MATRKHSAQYQQVMLSERWRRLRQALVHFRGNRCERCGKRGTRRWPLTVHHLHYGRLGREQLRDVLLLCRPCHRKADRARWRLTRARGDRKDRER